MIPIKARPFDLKRVRLLDGPFKDAMERDRAYLHALESDRLLHTFRVNAGLPSSAEPLGGWEEPNVEVRGHTLGHYLSACAMMYASTGDEKLKAKADAIVAELAKCQKALGSGGYLSAFPEEFIDRVEARKRVWAPYYTLHKIYAGLLDMYVHCGNEQALEIARGMAAWTKRRTDRLDKNRVQRMLDATEQGGMNDALANLYSVTGDPDHLALSRRFNQNSYNEPLARREDHLKGLHVNSFIPNMIGTARQYKLTGEQVFHDIVTFFWDQVTGTRCYATGGTSHHEHWRTEPNVLSRELGPTTQETCCTYNMLKLTRHVFSWKADPRHADYYERALFNGILPTQNPEDGMMMYFVPLGSGWYKKFNLPRDSFWCCTGTGMESFAKLGDSIYFHDNQGAFVNLFIASELKWPEKGVCIRQETRFPEQQGTSLVIATEKPLEMVLRIRIPYWATRGVTVKINGQQQPVSAKPASYLVLKRTWKDGDRVDVDLPMSLHLHRMPDDPSVAAIVYGPLVLAGELGTENLTREMTHGASQGLEGDPVRAPDLVVNGKDLNAWVQPVAEAPLTFRTVGVGRPEDVTLVAFYRLFGQRYAVYWNLLTEEKWRAREAEREAREAREAARRKILQERMIDSVEIGNRASEHEHNLQGERTGAGRHMGKSWRHAPGGWFSYDLRVSPDQPMTLMCTWWGDESGQRTFDILVDGRKIATQTLLHNKPGEFFDVEYEIPPPLTRDKKKVTVKFQAHPANTAGGVFGCAMLKQKNKE